MTQGEPGVPRLVVGGWEIVRPVMVGPHQGELQPFAVGSLEEALIQRLLHESDAGIPIPVEQEDVDAVIRGQRYLTARPLGVGLVKAAPRGTQRLIVAREALS